ncbi:polysaccharide deacetylase family protein [Nocardioides sp.]|uniref:polysaccharide deacetylase family protein n=1 Tax=Nocardioides sp. TaxID=35761 RepID=UPI003783773E
MRPPVVRVRVLLAALAAVLVLPTVPAAAAPPRHHPGHQRPGHQQPVVPCSRGLVALTFDDGPLDSVTPRLVRVLQRLGVPATFFMVGSRVAEHPELVRLVDRAGFAIGNHTWAHSDLTTQTPAQVRHALVTTRRALLDAGVQPTDLARPPYGAIDDAARRVLADLGLVPVLWTIDSRDWTGLTPRQIRGRVVDAVRPHRTNVVLQHDGVANSPATLAALPEEVATLRRRGYCFASLDEGGNPTPPVPLASIEADRARITEGDRVGLTVRLDRPTTRDVTIRTTAGTVRVPAGSRSAGLGYRARQDRTDEAPEDVRFDVTGGRGVEPVAGGAVVRVVDDDPAPVVAVDDTTVTASPLLATAAPVHVRLDRSSDRDLPVVVRSALGPVRVTVPAGSRSATGALTVPVGRPSQQVRAVALRADGATATLTVRPPRQTWLEAARAAAAQVRWPTVRLSRLL